MQDLSIAIHYDSPDSDAVQLELDVKGLPLLFGAWEATVNRRGRRLKARGPWTESSVGHENNCDFLELTLPLEDDYQLERFFLLDHDDQLLIVGDSVLSCDDRPEKRRTRAVRPNLEYISTLPFAANLSAREEAESTELLFVRKTRGGKTKPVFRLLPMSLPEWKASLDAGPVRGDLGASDGHLTLRQQTEGSSMFAALFFDLSPKRLAKPYTWRHLAVGENLERVPEDHAVGFHTKLGKEQFLLYRSLTPPVSRTLLGHNLIDDFCFARFAPATGVEALVEIQQDFESC